jgi:hypothetical protein
MLWSVKFFRRSKNPVYTQDIPWKNGLISAVENWKNISSFEKIEIVWSVNIIIASGAGTIWI